jgi:ribonuclease PH
VVVAKLREGEVIEEEDVRWQKRFIKEIGSSDIVLQQNEIITTDGTVLGKYRFVKVEDVAKVTKIMYFSHYSRNSQEHHGYRDTTLMTRKIEARLLFVLSLELLPVTSISISTHHLPKIEPQKMKRK